MIRKATLADLPAIIELSVESVSINPLPVKLDREAMAATAREAIVHPSHFAWVGEQDGKVEAALLAAVQKGFWFRGCQASVLLYYARRPGDGVALIREFARWVKGRPIIKLAVFELEPESDPRLARLLERVGFGRMSRNCSYVRGQAG